MEVNDGCKGIKQLSKENRQTLYLLRGRII